MKNIKYVLSIGMICSLLLSGCANISASDVDLFEDVEFVDLSATVDRIKYNNFEALENASELVVVGTFVKDAWQKEFYQYVDVIDDEVLTSVISYNDIEITKVIKGDVKVGDTLTIRQSYGVADGCFYTDSELTPMMNGDTWIFFLQENYDTGIYFCSGDSQGRFPLEGHSYKKTALTENENLGVYDKNYFNESIYQDMLKKYDSIL